MLALIFFFLKPAFHAIPTHGFHFTTLLDICLMSASSLAMLIISLFFDDGTEHTTEKLGIPSLDGI
jgi:hypothetical protein